MCLQCIVVCVCVYVFSKLLYNMNILQGDLALCSRPAIGERQMLLGQTACVGGVGGAGRARMEWRGQGPAI